MKVSEQIGTESRSFYSDAPGYATHEVLNQPGALADYDAYSGDKALVEAVRVFGSD
jgi:putative acyl-CoA dehydrogenase